MKKSRIGIIVVLALVVIMLGGYIKGQIEESETVNEQTQIKRYEVDLDKGQYGIKKGQLAPDFTLETLSGETLTLSDLKGKKVLLNFWATWCPPCKKEMPDFQEYYENYAKDENVEIVAVNLTHSEKSITEKDVKENVQLFADSYGLTFPIPLMRDESVSKAYEIIPIPTTFMIDTEGRIQRHVIGPLTTEAIHEYVSQLN